MAIGRLGRLHGERQDRNKRIQSHMDRLGVVKSGWTVINVAAEQGYSSPDDLAAGIAVRPRVKLGVLLWVQGT